MVKGTRTLMGSVVGLIRAMFNRILKMAFRRR
jgi:hypothetical protein